MTEAVPPSDGSPQRVVLIGFSATGKSAVARALAGRLGRRALDTDEMVEEASGRTIAEIFRDDGEHAFRALEREAVARAATERGVVIATGGGVWLEAANREALADDGYIVGLEARLDTIMGRHAASVSGREDSRPLLAGGGADAGRRIEQLKAARQPFYALVDATIHTDAMSVDAVVDEIVHALERSGAVALASAARLHAFIEGPGVASTTPPDFGEDAVCTVSAGGSVYPVYCGWGLLDALPSLLDDVGLGSGRLFVVSDETVRDIYMEPVLGILRAAGRATASFSIAGGEANKNLAQLEELYGWLASERAERRDTVIALGGGVVTDLAGAAAATYLRGMPLVHVPTTLLGMVDAAIGGKVAVDLPAGKNLVGSFYQPRAVVADIAMLATLPERELRAGYGEVIKHALIGDEAMLDDLERDADALLALNRRDADRERAVALIGRNMALKAAVVSADERESDVRTLLNYGHTIGHAIEAVTEYGSFLHGEAVAIGLIGAAMIGERVGLIDQALVERHRRIIERFGLPTSVGERGPIDTEAVLSAMLSDKKVVGGRPRWVLLESVGRAVLRDDVPDDVVRAVVHELVSS